MGRSIITALSGLLALLVPLSLVPVQGRAAESAPVRSSRTVASLVTETNAATPGSPFRAGLRLVLAPGWHIYWQNPGDAGIAPSLDLVAPIGARAEPLQWPVPRRVAEGTLTTYAYSGDVVLPFVVTPGEGPFTLHGHAQWLACRDICVPEEADLDIQLPPGSFSPSPEAAMIAAAADRVPRPAPFAATLTGAGTLVLSGAAVPPGVTTAEFFPTKDGAVMAPAAEATTQAERVVVQLGRLPKDAGTRTVPGVLALTDRSGSVTAYELSPAVVPEAAPASSLAMLLLLAVAGGILLNAMPCVFPILAMKAVSLARLSGADRRRVRIGAASYCLGVVASFVALGAGLVAVRSAGFSAGWGFQFQSPLFVTGVAWLLFAVGLSLSGVFTVGGSLIGRGDSLARQSGHAGSFLTGVLAVVVASPCTAPFMGTAVAGALTLPAAASLAIFAALGLGLALPYGAIALVPRLSRMLPRPGAWMRLLQQSLAFPIYAAVVWLVWVASQQAGPAGVLSAGVGFIAVGVAAWLWGVAENGGRGARLAAQAGTVASVLFLGALLSGAGQAGQHAASEPFTTARLEQLRKEGRPVFVNMTASWCLSCLVNDRIALAPAAVQEAFARGNVAYLKGDWTSQDPAISAFLHQLGQDGVPLYVLYPPNAAPIVLPQLLTEGLVLGEIAKLKG